MIMSRIRDGWSGTRTNCQLMLNREGSMTTLVIGLWNGYTGLLDISHSSSAFLSYIEWRIICLWRIIVCMFSLVWKKVECFHLSSRLLVSRCLTPRPTNNFVLRYVEHNCSHWCFPLRWSYAGHLHIITSLKCLSHTISIDKTNHCVQICLSLSKWMFVC